MPKTLCEKMGVNVFHNSGTAWNAQQVERAINFCQTAGLKYIRPAFNLQQDEFDGTDNPWRLSWYHKIQDAGLTGIIGAYPQQIKNHLTDLNASQLIDQAVAAYAHIMDRFQADGINNFLVEAWNEADGGFATSDTSQSQTNDTIIDGYLTFNMKLYEECKKRSVPFMDLCSVQYPTASNLKHVLDCYNEKLNQYSGRPDWVSFHPYCQRDCENNIPEKYITFFDRSQWSNINDIPMAISEFGYPSEDWGHPFSGKFPFQYSRDMMIRQIIIQDYLNVDPIVIYSANTNPDPSDAEMDDCWGAYQYHKSDGSITLSDLGAAELKFLQTMQGYWLSNAVLVPSDHSQESLTYSNYAFEYTNDEGRKKLFYWNPFGTNTTSLSWNGNTYTLTFSQHVKELDDTPYDLMNPCRNPIYHLYTSQNRSNDVQTIMYNQNTGLYDAYWLNDPGQVWYHASTYDWRHWTKQNIAIQTGKGGTDHWYGAATGSIITNQGNITGVPKGAKVAYFVGYHDVQDIFACWSDDDGYTFSHPLNNEYPVLRWNANGTGGDKNNFRDPGVFYCNGKLYMYVAERNKFGVYTSDNGIDWSNVGFVTADNFMKGMTFSDEDTPIECPVIRAMKTPDGQNKAVLFFGGKNGEANQGTGTYYTVGYIDDSGMYHAETNCQRLDLGTDFYAANFSGSDDVGTPVDSLITLGWIGNWDYIGTGLYNNQNDHTYPNDKDQLTHHLGSYSLARKCYLQNDLTIKQVIDIPESVYNRISENTINPSNPLTSSHQPYTSYDNASVLMEDTGTSVALHYHFKFETSDNSIYKGRIYFDILQGADNVKFQYDTNSGWLLGSGYAKEWDNNETGMNASNAYQRSEGMYVGVINVQTLELDVYTDKNCVEIVFPNGKVWTKARFATQDTQDFKIYTQNPNNVNQLNVVKDYIN